MNYVLETIAKRYSCRSFDGRMPEKEKLDAIALAGLQAPSAFMDSSCLFNKSLKPIKKR